jgi:hypothetical protein
MGDSVKSKIKPEADARLFTSFGISCPAILKLHGAYLAMANESQFE